MRTEFKREMNRNYMILHPEEAFEESYTLRMLSENRIPGLLPFREKKIDGESFLYFDITSRQSLARMMEYRPFKAKEIRQITGDLVLTMSALERFLMDGDQICLDPDLIYVDPDGWKAEFCLLPGSLLHFETSFRKLARYILDHVDHMDGEAVILAFALLKAGEKGNLGIRDLEACLRSGEGEARESRTQEEIQTAEKKREDVENFISADRIPEKRQVKRKYDLPVPEKPKKPGNIQGKSFGSLVWSGIVLLLMLMIPAVFFLIGGIELISDWKWIILAAEGGLLAGSILLRPDKTENQSEDGEDEEDWEVAFREETFNEETWEEPEEKPQNKIPAVYEKLPEEEEMQTVLLTGHQIYPATRRLIPENGGEEIVVRYFPFIIGKSRKIADLCLNLPQISRIHAKLEENGEGYLITDLNSTNGTSVNGRILETNESVPLAPGETVAFADQSYRFV